MAPRGHLVSLDRGDGESIRVSAEDAVKLLDDQAWYGECFVRSWLDDVYERIDPRDVHPAPS